MSEPNANFALLLDGTCRRYPERTALTHAGRSLTYAEFAKLVDAGAAALRLQGGGPGRSVGLWLPNSPAYVTAFFATLWIGGTVAPLGSLLRPREVRQRLEIARPPVLVTTHAMAAQLNDAGTRVLAIDLSGDDLEGAGSVGPVVPRAAADGAVLVFTSGTTGVAKAAELTHGGLAWNTRALIDAFALTPEDVQLAAAPLSHVLGMTAVMCATLASGGALALMERFEPQAALALIEQTRTTGVMGAPPMFIALVREARQSGRAPAFRFAQVGGAALASEVGRSVEETFGCAVREGDGMSEVGGAITVTALHATPKPHSVGSRLPGSELRVVDVADRVALPPGERGEVQVRSPSAMRGYLGEPEATRAVLDEEGWLSTGDIGYLDGDGFLFLVDRGKELIIRSGYNVYPREVEDVLFGLPGVLEAAVLGVPHEEYGEEIVALVVAKGEGLDPEAVKAFAREHLAAYKYPRHVLVVDELPKGPTGKVSKRDIDRAAVIARLPPGHAKSISSGPRRP